MGKNIEESINYKFGLYLIDFLFGRDEAKYQSARLYMEHLAKNGNSDAIEALYLMGIKCYNSNDYEGALEFLTMAAELGNSDAQRFLGSDEYYDQEESQGKGLR